MASMHPSTQAFLDAALPERIPLAEDGPCDTPQIALGVSGKLDNFGDCVDCGFPGACHDY